LNTHDLGNAVDPPAGFRPSGRHSGFLDLIGPLYIDDTDPRAPVFGLRLDERHMNSRGRVHGGVLTTLADSALGYGVLAADGQDRAILTASLTINYTGSAADGHWIEVRTSLKRMGSRLAFAGCEITCEGRPVASCSGVFSVPPQQQS
jgi:uncharacterized protein (TIGR00369 family)